MKEGLSLTVYALCLQIILPVQSGLSIIRRSPVPPDAVIESKVCIFSSVNISGKVLTLLRTVTRAFPEICC